MAMGQQKDRQGDLMVGWAEMPRSPGHVFYDRLQSVLIEGGFDAFAEASCRPYYAARMGAPSVPPGRYFRMQLLRGHRLRRGLSGVARIPCRCGSSCDWGAVSGCRTIPGCRRPARACPMKSTRGLRLGSALIGEAGLEGRAHRGDASTMEANGPAQHRAARHG